MKRNFALRLLLFLFKWTIIPLLLATAGVVVLYFAVRNDLPDLSPLQTFSPMATTKLYDRTGALIAQYQDPHIRVWAPIESVSKDAINAVTSAEDPNFYKHTGVDLQAIWEAIKIDIQNMAYVRGASTLTQQLMKNLLLTREKTLTRKMKEVLLATKVETMLNKRQILEQYLNQVEWGDGIYGIEAASRYYFGKPAEKLQMHEGALLAGMLPNPKYFSPYVRLQRLRVRQKIILKLMWQNHHISKPEYLEAVDRPVVLASRESRSYNSSDLRTRVLSKPIGYRLIAQTTLEDRLGRFKMWQGGLTLRTTLDLDTLRTAEKYLGKPDKIVDPRYALLLSGENVVAFGIAPGKNDADFMKWLAERKLDLQIVEDTLPWDRILVISEAPVEGAERGQ